MNTRLHRWGNSLGLRIPKILAEEMGVEEGSVVELTLDEQKRLVIHPAPGPSYELRDLLARVTPKNRHGEVPSGAARGREVW